MGQVDYALIGTLITLAFVILSLPGNGGFNNWIIFFIFAAPLAFGFYALLEATFVAVGVMRPL